MGALHPAGEATESFPKPTNGLKGALALAAETAACLPCHVGKTIALLRGKGRPTTHTTPAKISSNAPPAI